MGKRGRPPHPDILTPREWEVLALLRQGLTNREIAARLDITLHGARYHVSQIISRLGVATREEAAAWRPQEAPAATLRPWWQRLFAPLTLAKAAGIAASLAAVVGLAVLAWGVLRTSEGDDESAVAATDAPARTDIATPTPLPSLAATPSPAEQPLGPLLWEAAGRDYHWRRGLYMMDPNGRLALGATDVGDMTGQHWAGRSFDWSPDGARLAYLSSRRGSLLTTLTMLDVGSGERTPLSIAPLNAGGEMAWSPDGRYLALNGFTYDANNDGWPGLLILDLEAGMSVAVQEQGFTPFGPITWSADSTRIAVGTGYANGVSRVVILDVSGRLVDEIPNAEMPAWSPDGALIAYHFQGSGLFVVDAETKAQVAAVPNGYHPVWSPDGEWIAYERYEEAEHRIGLLSRDGATVRHLTNGHTAAWSSEGGEVTVIRDGNLFSAAIDGSGERQLTSSPMPFVAAPLWSPDSGMLAFVWTTPGLSSWAETVRTVNLDGSGERELFPGVNPRWSPDGESIAFESMGLYRVRPDGTGLLKIGGNFIGTDVVSGYGCTFPLTWSPDAAKIAYAESYGGVTVVTADGKAVFAVANLCAGFSPDFSRAAYVDRLQSGCFVRLVKPEELRPNVVQPSLCGAPHWSPDGTLIAFGDAGNVYVADVAETLNPWIVGKVNLPDYEGPDTYQLEWSPDSKRLAYATDGVISVVNADGSGETLRIPVDGVAGWDIDWSADSVWLAYTVSPSEVLDGSERSIIVSRSDGSGPPVRVAYGHSPDWSPDGRQIGFVR